jgi:hypothetical protein
LIIFLEHPVSLIGRDSRSRVQNLNGDRRTSSPAADQNASLVGIANGIRDEVAQDALQQDRVAIDDRGGWCPNQRQPLGNSFCLMIPAYPFKQSPHRKGLPVDLDGAGIELRDVEQRRKQPVHRDCRFLNLFDQPLSLQRHDDAAQSADKQPKRMNGLS